ncbi:hypothetical protein N1851_019835 [Merluccius polli]|uniref:Uncharacterized protein n=1 Tax=Merluccius polli TaxID=89951 RepID=A0AA47ML59_MERPO|nr:hypothetical protein N1851_019835 [Merluccius polli]
MSKTFALRRHEIINQCPTVRAMKDRWPALFDPSQDSVHSSVERTREVVLKCLIEYLGEQGGHLIKEFNKFCYNILGPLEPRILAQPQLLHATRPTKPHREQAAHNKLIYLGQILTPKRGPGWAGAPVKLLLAPVTAPAPISQ